MAVMGGATIEGLTRRGKGQEQEREKKQRKGKQSPDEFFSKN